MGCSSCGGGRHGAQAVVGSAGGVPVAWRLTHPSGGTVDFTSPVAAEDEKRRVPGSTVQKVDTRTGQPVE
jgi:hypothetical protein